jgi:hypothetical protein
MYDSGSESDLSVELRSNSACSRASAHAFHDQLPDLLWKAGVLIGLGAVPWLALFFVIPRASLSGIAIA